MWCPRYVGFATRLENAGNLQSDYIDLYIYIYTYIWCSNHNLQRSEHTSREHRVFPLTQSIWGIQRYRSRAVWGLRDISKEEFGYGAMGTALRPRHTKGQTLGSALCNHCWPCWIPVQVGWRPQFDNGWCRRPTTYNILQLSISIWKGELQQGHWRFMDILEVLTGQTLLVSNTTDSVLNFGTVGPVSRTHHASQDMNAAVFRCTTEDCKHEVLLRGLWFAGGL